MRAKSYESVIFEIGIISERYGSFSVCSAHEMALLNSSGFLD